MKNTTLIAMTFATLFTTSLMTGTAAAAQECKSFSVSASGESAGAVAKFRLRRAERRAKQGWEQFVAQQYGTRFADIDKAIYTTKMSCTLNASGNTKCTIVAKPCAH